MPNLRTSRKSGLVLRGGSRRRQTLWLADTDPTGFTLLAAGTAVLQNSLNAAALSLRPFTVVRSRGLLSIISDQQTASEEPLGAVGGIVVTDQASAAGVASVPTPSSESSSDWFFYEYFCSTAVLLSSVGWVEPTVMNVPIDSKAMRKVDLGEDLIMVLENGNGTHGLRFQLRVKVLIKLH